MIEDILYYVPTVKNSQNKSLFLTSIIAKLIFDK